MRAQKELEYVVALVQEYLATLQPATRLAVSNYAQQCINAVSAALDEAEAPSDPIQPETKPETKPEKASD